MSKPVPEGVKRAKIIAFFVNTHPAASPHSTPWLTELEAHAGAKAHQDALVAAGDTWANTPAALYDQYQGDGTGLLIGSNTPSLADPPSSVRMDFHGEDWSPTPGEASGSDA